MVFRKKTLPPQSVAPSAGQSVAPSAGQSGNQSAGPAGSASSEAALADHAAQLALQATAQVAAASGSALAVPLAAPLGDAVPGSLEERVAGLLYQGRSVVLVTVLSHTGSAPRHAGTRALLTDTGPEGTIGGGLLEAQAFEAALRSLEGGISARVSCDMTGFAPDSDMICGGSIEVLCEALLPAQAPLFALAGRLLRTDAEGGFWSVDVSREMLPRRCLHLPDLPEAYAAEKDVPGLRVEPGATLPEKFRRSAGVLADAERSVYLEPLSAPPVLLLCGGGHVSLATATLAHAAGFVVDVADDRVEFANAERFPMARRCFVLPDFDNVGLSCQIGRRHHIAIMTRGHRFDLHVLSQALGSRACYIGMIGSRSKREQVYAALRDEGVALAELAAVRCPIGLTLGAETPEQIAVAIVAELLAARAGTLQRLRFDD